MNRKIFIVFVLLLYCPISQLRADNYYSEYWQKFFWEMWTKDSFSLGTYVKIETGNHFKKVRSLQLSEQLSYQVSDNFSVEAHYSYLHGHSIVKNSPWHWQHRLELEANRTFNLPCNALLKTRNRLEIRKIEEVSKVQYRLRQLIMLVVPFEKTAVLQSFSMYNELFYDISTHLFNQDRLCPFQLTFSLSDKIDLDLFFLIRFFLDDEVWQKSAVLGTQLSY